MGKQISKFIFNKILGWQISGKYPVISRCVIAVAPPHTSNWDFVVAKLGYSSIGRTANFLMKREWFVFPFNLLFKNIGGIPVDRGKSSSLTNTLAEEFEKKGTYAACHHPPEGTRKPVKEWKKGVLFYSS